MCAAADGTFRVGCSSSLLVAVLLAPCLAGKDLFAAPYDWRQDLTAMDQNIGDSKLLDRLAARIRRIVATNGGRKAVLLTHSMGGIVALELLTKSRFAAWRCAPGGMRQRHLCSAACAGAVLFISSSLCARVRVQGGKRARLHHPGDAVWWRSQRRCVQGWRLPILAAECHRGALGRPDQKHQLRRRCARAACPREGRARASACMRRVEAAVAACSPNRCVICMFASSHPDGSLHACPGRRAQLWECHRPSC